MSVMVIGSVLAVLLPVLVGVIAIGLIKRCPPNCAMIISGYAAGVNERSFKILTSGVAVVLPMLQQVKFISLATHNSRLSLDNAYASDGVPLALTASLQFKIRANESGIAMAAENFLGKTDAQLQEVVVDIVEQTLISLIAHSDHQSLCADQTAISSAVNGGALSNLNNLGLELVAFKIDSLQLSSRATGRPLQSEAKQN
jgi:flotillin